ncbi:MAG: DNRLRE domain-containing protein [Minicystis sp.]
MSSPEPVLEAASASSTCITIQRGTSGTVADAMIRSDAPTTNQGASGSLTESAASTAYRHALIKWDVSAVPSGATVTSATASIKVNLNGGYTVNAHQLTQAWSESTVTWGNDSDAASPSTPVAATFSAATAGTRATANLTTLVQGWVSGAYANNGVVLERDDLTNSTVYASSEDATVANRPSLQVCYTTGNPCTGVTCNPIDGCHTAACNPSNGQCVQTAVADGTACNDGTLCTQTDTCQAGVCVGANPITCTASDQCHAVGTCNPSTGVCSNPLKPDGATCDDGNASTPYDMCVAGVCTGETASPWTLWGGGQGSSTCATYSGQLKCWGLNSYGQLGLGDTANRGDNPGEMSSNLATVDLGTGRSAVMVAPGYNHACAVLDNGQLKCWGYGWFGALGYGDQNSRGGASGQMGDNLPAIDLGTGRTATYVAVGDNHTCAILDNGQVKCWGYNYWGQLGLGDQNFRGDDPGEMGDNLPAVDLGTTYHAVALSLSGAFSCALLDNGQVKCWGYNQDGELGTGDQNPHGYAAGTMGSSLPAVSFGTGRYAIAIASGSFHSCALLDNHQVKCWGANAEGELGDGDTTTRGWSGGTTGNFMPAANLGTGRTAVAISVGSYFSCALLDNDQVKCWGAGYSYWDTLGYGDTLTRGDNAGEMGDNLPAVDLGTGRHATRIVAGSGHTCAALDNLQVKCWGTNNFGMLGVGDNVTRGDNAGEMGDNLPVTDLGN